MFICMESRLYRIRRRELFPEGGVDMSIDRFILKKLAGCQEERTRVNLVELFKLRIHKAEKAEKNTFKTS